MRILLDTNVLISAFIAHGTCHEVFEHVAIEHQLIVSDYILDEFAETMVEKFDFTHREAADARNLIRGRARVVKPISLRLRQRIDPDDLPVLGTAIAATCDCMITGDKELLRLDAVEGIPVLAPGAFWKWEAEHQG